jgi:hypothetical protein
MYKEFITVKYGRGEIEFSLPFTRCEKKIRGRFNASAGNRVLSLNGNSSVLKYSKSI